ncbi:MAG: SusD/RagB family nutrient-binding outer membrane lipoprotein [Bacteroidota bacterium]|nr:SusD/RagB family nutrient-binding outer membrane lipoprotein [Bacteroidota bacterium]
MKKINILNIALVIGFILLGSSCTKDWDEMNTDPNNPNDVPYSNILAHTLRTTGDVFFDDWQGMNNFLSYSGQVTKIQYIDEARYKYRVGVVNRAWENYYTLLNDVQKMKMKAIAAERPKMEAVAEIYACFLWQMATDQWKDIPYTEALNGDAEEENLAPAYDSQESIYLSLIDRLAAANATLNLPVNNANPEVLGDGDVLFGGDFSKWQKFGNGLRLRIAMRISDVNPTKSAAIVAALNGQPMMESNDDNAFLIWPGAAPYKEPWAENQQDRDDHAVAKTMIDKLIELNDPRLAVYADTIADGTYVGAIEGDTDAHMDPNACSRIGARFRTDLAGFTPFMRYSEVMFNLAEANMDVAAYEAGVIGSMLENGIDQDVIDQYLLDNVWDGTEADIEVLYVQKWIAMFKQGQEVWAFSRRVDYPNLPCSVGSAYGDKGSQPVRYPYPDNEFNLNGSNLAGHTTGIDDKFWGQKMWWDVN